ncbi:MAG: hypothetical protein EKK31_18545 [Hyphomicrobiales bacterium]|nr:MAG: hypothetical protein EKK31_18545 [Hyphomicrobiales bacterium]
MSDENDSDEDDLVLGDIVSELTYVITNQEVFDKDALILSMRSALVNIIELRLELGVLKKQLTEHLLEFSTEHLLECSGVDEP